MRIGIIGAGNIGGALARRLGALGHEVAIANSRGPETLGEFDGQPGVTAVTAAEAAHGRDLVVVTIPQAKVVDLPADLFANEPADLVIVDTGNYYPQQRDGRIAAIEDGAVESEWVAEQLGRPVVKAFNNIYADHLEHNGKDKGVAGRTSLPVAADDEHARSVVMGLVDELGFDPVDAGPLSGSWRQQPGTPVYGTDLDAYDARHALTEARPERPADFTATDKSPGSYEQPE